jgi:hypothetical protein
MESLPTIWKVYQVNKGNKAPGVPKAGRSTKEKDPDESIGQMVSGAKNDIEAICAGYRAIIKSLRMELIKSRAEVEKIKQALVSGE